MDTWSRHCKGQGEGGLQTSGRRAPVREGGGEGGKDGGRAELAWDGQAAVRATTRGDGDARREMRRSISEAWRLEEGRGWVEVRGRGGTARLLHPLLPPSPPGHLRFSHGHRFCRGPVRYLIGFSVLLPCGESRLAASSRARLTRRRSVLSQPRDLIKSSADS
jgi:hypothetical protein